MKRVPQVVVITGGSAGVGRAAAQAFAKRGAKVAGMARGQDRLDDTVRELKELGASDALGIRVDVADPQQVEKAAQQVEEKLGPIDVWVNNAMVTVFAPFIQVTASEFRRVTEVTYLGAVHGTMAALQRMLPRNHGVIVQVGSALSDRSIPLQSAYCGAKHAIRGFTDAIRCELIHEKSRVRVTMVQMPALNTPQFDWMLGNSNYDAQQTNEPEDPSRPYNLWDPVPVHFGAHGRFDDRARKRSVQLWASKHISLRKSVIRTAVLLCAIGSGVLLARGARRKSGK